MIRRDYILRMIEDFIAALRRLREYKKDESWTAADDELNAEFKRVVGVDAPAAAQLSETELLAKMMQGEATLFLHDKTFMLATLFMEAGDVAVANGRPAEGRTCYLKGLHLLLGGLGRQGDERAPEFVPTVETFVTALQEDGIPARTQVMLMQHYESTGQFACAEDALFAIVEEEANSAVIDFGTAFYGRLLNLSDDVLERGNLPRAEVEAGLAELSARKTARA